HAGEERLRPGRVSARTSRLSIHSDDRGHRLHRVRRPRPLVARRLHRSSHQAHQSRATTQPYRRTVGITPDSRTLLEPLSIGVPAINATRVRQLTTKQCVTTNNTLALFYLFRHSSTEPNGRD